MVKEKNFAFYIMGPSGAGKDTVIQAIGQHFQTQMVIPPRYITRKNMAGEMEQHNVLSPTVFQEMQTKDCFSLSWEANGSHYAYDKQWLNDIASGKLVLLNGSRAYWPIAKEKFAGILLPIQLSLDIETQRARLENRARESQHEIDARILRSQQLSDDPDENIFYVNSNQSLTCVVREVVDYLIEKGEMLWR